MKPRPSRYNGAICKELAIFLKSVQLFCLQLERSKEGEHLGYVGTLIKLGGSCGSRETGCRVRGTGCG